MLGNHYTRDTVGALESQMESDLGLKPSEYSTLNSLYFMPNIILPLFTGYLCDVSGYPSRFLVYTAIVCAVGNILFVLGAEYNSLYMFYIGRFLAGCVYEIIDTIPIIILGPLFKANWGLMVGVLNGSVRFGTVLTFGLSPIMYRQYSVVAAFWLSALMAVLAVGTAVLAHVFAKQLLVLDRSESASSRLDALYAAEAEAEAEAAEAVGDDREVSGKYIGSSDSSYAYGYGAIPEIELIQLKGHPQHRQSYDVTSAAGPGSGPGAADRGEVSERQSLLLSHTLTARTPEGAHSAVTAATPPRNVGAHESSQLDESLGSQPGFVLAGTKHAQGQEYGQGQGQGQGKHGSSTRHQHQHQHQHGLPVCSPNGTRFSSRNVNVLRAESHLLTTNEEWQHAQALRSRASAGGGGVGGGGSVRGSYGGDGDFGPTGAGDILGAGARGNSGKFDNRDLLPFDTPNSLSSRHLETAGYQGYSGKSDGSGGGGGVDDSSCFTLQGFYQLVLHALPFRDFGMQFYFYLMNSVFLFGAIVPFWFLGSKFLQLNYNLEVEQADFLMLMPEGAMVVVSPLLGFVLDYAQLSLRDKLVLMGVVNFGMTLALIAFAYGYYAVNVDDGSVLNGQGDAHMEVRFNPLYCMLLLSVCYACSNSLTWDTVVLVVPDPSLLAPATGLCAAAVNVLPTIIPYLITFLNHSFGTSSSSTSSTTSAAAAAAAAADSDPCSSVANNTGLLVLAATAAIAGLFALLAACSKVRVYNGYTPVSGGDNSYESAASGTGSGKLTGRRDENRGNGMATKGTHGELTYKKDAGSPEPDYDII
jgi:hypothetical protein